MSTANKIVNAVIKDLKGRKGILDGLDDDILEEITDDLETVVEQHLPLSAEAFPVLADLHDSLVLSAEHDLPHRTISEFVQKADSFNTATVFLHKNQYQ